MEYPSKNDIFMKFKVLYDANDKFIDYILIDTSENFHNVINYKSNPFIGKKISEIALNQENDIFDLKHLYYHMIPNTRRKFEMYIEKLETWYLVNIFSDEKDYLLIFYTDINRYKMGDKKPTVKPFDAYERKVKHCM